MTSREAVALGRFRPCVEQQLAKASAVLQAKYVYPRGIACVAYEGDNGYAALSQRVGHGISGHIHCIDKARNPKRDRTTFQQGQFSPSFCNPDCHTEDRLSEIPV